MNPAEIMAMAREAGFEVTEHAIKATNVFGEIDEELARFAALVAEKAVAKDREACAQVCDAERQDFGGVAAGPMTTDAGKRVHEAMAAGAATCAAAIRARGTKEGA